MTMVPLFAAQMFNGAGAMAQAATAAVGGAVSTADEGGERGVMNDHSGNAEYAARFEQATWLRVIAITCFLMLIASLSGKPMAVAATRPGLWFPGRSQIGRAEPVRYNLNDYTPREAEIRSRL